ncbi:RNase H domain-containing protein [Trichonephila clavipes]|nr:RNase H domain-containing protein [Trichonephila clavipes]
MPNVNKMSDYPKLLKQLALEGIDGIPLDTVKILIAIVSHVGLPGNEVADDLAKATASDPVDLEDHIVLKSTEIYFRAKELISRAWVVFPVHP